MGVQSLLKLKIQVPSIFRILCFFFNGHVVNVELHTLGFSVFFGFCVFFKLDFFGRLQWLIRFSSIFVFIDIV